VEGSDKLVQKDRQAEWYEVCLPHDAMIARYMLWACVCVCLSATSQCSTKIDETNNTTQ